MAAPNQPMPGEHKGDNKGNGETETGSAVTMGPTAHGHKNGTEGSMLHQSQRNTGYTQPNHPAHTHTTLQVRKTFSDAFNYLISLRDTPFQA